MVKVRPGKYFISHSYKDESVRKRMLRLLPGGVEPLIFPPITVSPSEFVSNSLIEAILDCDGLIYLKGGYSSASFWVAFERDYALRAGKSVYYYEPKTREFGLHSDRALDLSSATLVTGTLAAIREYGNELVELMRKRHVAIWIDPHPIQTPLIFMNEVFEVLGEQSKHHNIVLLAGLSREDFEKWAEDIHQPAKTILVCMAKPPASDEFLEDCKRSLRFVQLWGDDKLSQKNRYDDLIVRIYWLAYQNTQYRNFD